MSRGAYLRLRYMYGAVPGIIASRKFSACRAAFIATVDEVRKHFALNRLAHQKYRLSGGARCSGSCGRRLSPRQNP
jgi:hypothetical protein